MVYYKLVQITNELKFLMETCRNVGIHIFANVNIQADGRTKLIRKES